MNCRTAATATPAARRFGCFRLVGSFPARTIRRDRQQVATTHMSDPQATAPASETPESVTAQTSNLAPPFERVLGCLVEFFPMILLVFIPVLGGLLATA